MAPVVNFVSEKQDFTHGDRVPFLATGFYEYTDSVAPKVKLGPVPVLRTR